MPLVRAGPRDAELIRPGENALFRLSSQPVVVRMARTVDYWGDVVKEVEVARWLAEQQIPAARLHDVPQSVLAGGYPVTSWRYIAGRPGDGRDIAALGECSAGCIGHPSYHFRFAARAS
jgi:hypothetical protein